MLALNKGQDLIFPGFYFRSTKNSNKKRWLKNKTPRKVTKQKTNKKKMRVTKIFKDNTCCINHTFWCSSCCSKYIRCTTRWQSTPSCGSSNCGYSQTTWRGFLYRYHHTPVEKRSGRWLKLHKGVNHRFCLGWDYAVLWHRCWGTHNNINFLNLAEIGQDYINGP